MAAPSWERFNFIEGMAAKMRQSTTNPQTTNIGVGKYDFELRTRPHQISRYFDRNNIMEWNDIRPTKIPSNAPTIDLNYQPRNKAPGRINLPTPPASPGPPPSQRQPNVLPVSASGSEPAPAPAQPTGSQQGATGGQSEIQTYPTSDGLSSQEASQEQAVRVKSMPPRSQSSLGNFTAPDPSVRPGNPDMLPPPPPLTQRPRISRIPSPTGVTRSSVRSSSSTSMTSEHNMEVSAADNIREMNLMVGQEQTGIQIHL